MSQIESPLQIAVPGLERALRVLHLTDGHVCQPDDASPFAEKCFARRSRWAAEEQEARFEVLLAEAKNSEADLLLLTGDVVDFPSQKSLDWVGARLESCGKPWLYVSGNHDWYFHGQKPNASLRREQYSRIAPLFPSGEASLAYRHEVAGLQFLCVDNSTYQIETKQLEFVRQTLQNGLPTVLLIHIPITQPRLREPTMAKWGDAILMGDQIDDERRPLWAWETDRPETVECIELLRNAPNLHAIFCGHVHFSHEEMFSDSAVQLVGAPAFDGGFRMVIFMPV